MAGNVRCDHLRNVKFAWKRIRPQILRSFAVVLENPTWLVHSCMYVKSVIPILSVGLTRRGAKPRMHLVSHVFLMQQSVLHVLADRTCSTVAGRFASKVFAGLHASYLR